MKKIAGTFLILMLTFKIGFPQPNGYYLSVCGAVSDAGPEMNSITLGTGNMVVIQGVPDKAKSHPIIVCWDGKYSVTGLKIYSDNVVGAEGQIGHISASNIIHKGAGTGQGTFNPAEGIAIPEIVQANYTGDQPLGGKGKFQRTKGEDF